MRKFRVIIFSSKLWFLIFLQYFFSSVAGFIWPLSINRSRKNFENESKILIISKVFMDDSPAWQTYSNSRIDEKFLKFFFFFWKNLYWRKRCFIPYFKPVFILKGNIFILKKLLYQNQLFVLNSKPAARLAYRARLPQDLQKWLIFGVIHAVVEGNFLSCCQIKSKTLCKTLKTLPLIGREKLLRNTSLSAKETNLLWWKNLR